MGVFISLAPKQPRSLYPWSSETMSNILGGLLPGDFLGNELLSEVSPVVHPLKARAAAVRLVIFIKLRRLIDFSGIVATFQILLSGVSI